MERRSKRFKLALRRWIDKNPNLMIKVVIGFCVFFFVDFFFFGGVGGCKRDIAGCSSVMLTSKFLGISGHLSVF